MLGIFPESFPLLGVTICVCGEGETNDGAEAGLILRNRLGLGRREVRLGGVTHETLTADWAWHRVCHSDPQTEHTEMLIRRQRVDKCGDLIK